MIVYQQEHSKEDIERCLIRILIVLIGIGVLNIFSCVYVCVCAIFSMGLTVVCCFCYELLPEKQQLLQHANKDKTS